MDSTRLTKSLELAMQHYVAKRLQQAEEIYLRILSEHPNHPDALHLLGVVKFETQKGDEAVQLIKSAIALRPNAPEYHNNLGTVFASQRRFDDAIVAFSRAVSLRPNYAIAQSNLGAALTKSGRYESAIHAYQCAIAASPGYAEAHWNRALLLLLQGNYVGGLEEYEYRLQVPQLAEGKRRCTVPRWDGQDFRGKSILLHTEQGYGDAIQFVRYLPLVAEKGGNIILEVQPELCRLFRGTVGARTLVSQGQPLPAFDLHCPLASLPMTFGTTLASIPNKVPYVVPSQELVTRWRKRLGDEKRFRVGLAWAGNPRHHNDPNRSISLSTLGALKEPAGIDFFSLQKVPAARQTPPEGMKLIDWTDDMQDFAETAALVANLDMVVSVDTAAAHLAGAMGKKVFLLVPFVPDWRWLLNREDSPWYPTMRLFRQPQPDNWDTPIRQLTDALASISKQ